jgi:hypothetical protein
MDWRAGNGHAPEERCDRAALRRLVSIPTIWFTGSPDEAMRRRRMKAIIAAAASRQSFLTQAKM